MTCLHTAYTATTSPHDLRSEKMANFNCFNTGCMMKSEVKTEVTAVVIEPLPPTIPQQTRPTSARIYRPWEDSPSRPMSPSTPQSSSSPSLSSSPSSHSSSPSSYSSSPSAHSSSPSVHSSSPSAHSSLPSTHSSSPSAHSSSPSPHSSSPSSHSSSPSAHRSTDVVRQHTSFLQAVSRLQVRVPPADTWLATLVSCYMNEVFRLETYRSHALVAVQPPAPAMHDAVHVHYDTERLALLQQANSSLLGYSCTLTSRVTSLQQRHAYQQMTPPTTPQGCHLDRSYSSGSGASSPDSTPSPRIPHSRIAIDDTPSKRTSSSRSCSSKRLLGAAVVRLLEAWYSRHQHYPYADAAQVRHLAAAGGITLVQVRKWLANRRLRGHNTTGYVGKSLRTRRASSSDSSQ